MTTSGIEAPLPHGFDGSLIESAAKRASNPDAADTAVASNNNLENHVALNSLTPRVVCIDRPHFLDERGRIDARAGLIHTAASAAAGTCAETAAAAFTNTLPGTRSHTVTIAGTAARLARWRFWNELDASDAIEAASVSPCASA